MSRKRFIKLMMARGYSRNLAAPLATQVSRYGSYVALYQRFSSLGSPIMILRATCHAAAHAFDGMAAAFTALAESARRAFNG